MKQLTLLPALLLLTACPNITGKHKSEAQAQAKAYAKELGYQLDKVSCVRQDTDGDGYVSCTLKMADGASLNVECAGAWNLNSGCREPKINAGRLRGKGL